MPPSWHPVPACVRSGCCRRNHSSLPLRRLESDAKQRRLNDRSRRNHSSLPQGKLVLDAENRCRYGRCSRNHSSLPLRRLESDAERCGGRVRCSSGGFVLRIMPPSWHPVPACSQRLCCRRAIHRCSNDGAASIRKSGLEIKNRCTKEGVNREKLASIRKSGPEIKNRCTKEGVNREKLTSIRKFGPEIKNRCTHEGVNGEDRAGHPQHAFIR